jgi:hypothetical protein
MNRGVVAAQGRNVVDGQVHRSHGQVSRVARCPQRSVSQVETESDLPDPGRSAGDVDFLLRSLGRADDYWG